MSEPTPQEPISPAGPEPQWFEEARARWGHLESLFATLRSLETGIEANLQAAAEVLKYSQPIAPGKLGLRWWKMRGRARKPVVVEWQWRKDGRRWQKPVEGMLANRGRTQGAFSVNRSVTVEALRIVARLFETRPWVVKSKRGLESLMDQAEGMLKEVEWQGRRLAQLEAEALENMRRYYGEQAVERLVESEADVASDEEAEVEGEKE